MLPSQYAQYLLEREGAHVFETPRGFASYSIHNAEVYVRDLWVHPDFRKSGEASSIADSIAGIAKDKGCTLMTGTVDPRAKGAADSMKVLLAYGMRPHSISNGLVWFCKEIE